MKRLGVLVVGQSPRTEIEAEFLRLIPDAGIELVGCLDGYSNGDLRALAPASGPTLFTRLPCGASITLPKAEVVRAGRAKLDGLMQSGADGVVVLCTGDFPDWRMPGVLFAADLFRGSVLSLCPAGRLGVLAPLESQLDDAVARWSDDTCQAHAVALSPNAGASEIKAAANSLRAFDPNLLVLDCVSYTRQTKALLCAHTDRPGALAITAVARAAAEWLEG